MRILIAQNDSTRSSELERFLRDEPNLAVVGVSKTAADALKETARHHPDVVLMDCQLHDISGPSAAEMILAANPATAIVFHGFDDSEDALFIAIDAGATAYLTKDASPQQILAAVRRAARGDLSIPRELFDKAVARRQGVAAAGRPRERLLAELKPRELEVLQLLAMGLDTALMSRQLGIAPHTVEWHLRYAIEKLEVHSKLQAVVAAARLGLIDVSGSQ
jgi:DNA-binding NarL/FixJ family response regulator